MTTTPTPTPENPDRPYTVHKDGHCWEVRRGSELFYASIHESWSRDHVTKLNDAHEAAAKAKRDADRVPAVAAEVTRLREALDVAVSALTRAKGRIEGLSEVVFGKTDECRYITYALTKAESTTRPEERK